MYNPVKQHDDWITHMAYLSTYSGLLTSSMDGALRLMDLDRQETVWACQEHLRGVHHFDYCASFNFIASCGIERDVLMWNPFSGQSVGRLKGHNASVRRIAVNDRDSLVYTLAADNSIKVWDVRNNSCMQTISDDTSYWPEQGPNIMIFCHQHEQLVLAASRLTTFEKKNSGKREDPSLAVALTNTSFEEVICVLKDGTVCVLDCRNGATIFSFSTGLVSDQVKSAALDSKECRLMIGTQNGYISLWNFSNGQLLDELRGYGEREVTTVMHVKDGPNRFFCAAGWNGALMLFEDPAFFDYASKRAARKATASSCDFNSVDFSERHNCIITGAMESSIVIWRPDCTPRATIRLVDHDFSHQSFERCDTILP